MTLQVPPKKKISTGINKSGSGSGGNYSPAKFLDIDDLGSDLHRLSSSRQVVNILKQGESQIRTRDGLG